MEPLTWHVGFYYTAQKPSKVPNYIARDKKQWITLSSIWASREGYRKEIVFKL
jgi:hypothetical protein